MRPDSVRHCTSRLEYRAHTLYGNALKQSTAIAQLRIRSACLATTQNMCRGGDFVHSEQRRIIHSSEKKSSTMMEYSETASSPSSTDPSRAPLSVLPLGMIVRSLATTIVSSSPLLLPPSLRLMAALAHNTKPLLNPDKNPVLRKVLKKSFYAQFCAGEDAAEVRQTITRLKGIGFTGVILGYAKEVVLSKQEAGQIETSKFIEETQELMDKEIIPWTQSTLETIRMAAPGDCVALKLTGAGRVALHRLSLRLSPSPYLAQSIHSICQLAHECGVRLLFDAEQDMLQDGIDDWTVDFARKYNKSPERATIYGTYQAYKKCTPSVLSRHLLDAQKGNFSLGIKLVRGAYLGSDPRECFHDTKAETDACYDSLAASILTRQWSTTLKGEGDFPATHLVLATHNTESVRRARAICDAGGAKSSIIFAQLQGMADEISCELIETSHSMLALPTYKYLVWGTTGECMKYLMRRAQENKDAVQRTRDCRNAMWTELVRRCRNALCMAPR